MTPASGSRDQNPRLFRTIQQDVGRVGSEVRRAGIRGTVVLTFADLREFYLSEEHRERLAAMGRVKSTLYFAWWLLKGLFFKLTPARRVLVLVAFFFLFQGSGTLVASGRLQVTIDVGWVGVVLILLVLALELKDKLVAREELEAGRAVQIALMPEPAPMLPGWSIWLFTRPANDVGGDLVDFLRIEEQRAFVVLGDVAGKGLPAALLMAKLQATIRGLAPEFTSLPEIGARVNRILYRDGLPNRFATLVYLEASPASGRVRVLNAGHMPPLVVSGSGTVAELSRGSFALGMMPDARYEEQSTELARGDTLVAYSDGATEAMNAAGDFFGDDRFKALLASIPALPVAVGGAKIVAAVDAFVGAARPHDDLSLVLLRRE